MDLNQLTDIIKTQNLSALKMVYMFYSSIDNIKSATDLSKEELQKIAEQFKKLGAEMGNKR